MNKKKLYSSENKKDLKNWKKKIKNLKINLYEKKKQKKKKKKKKMGIIMR